PPTSLSYTRSLHDALPICWCCSGPSRLLGFNPLDDKPSLWDQGNRHLNIPRSRYLIFGSGHGSVLYSRVACNACRSDGRFEIRRSEEHTSELQSHLKLVYR